MAGGLARFRPYVEDTPPNKTRKGSESGSQNQVTMSKARLGTGSCTEDPGGSGTSCGVVRSGTLVARSKRQTKRTPTIDQPASQANHRHFQDHSVRTTVEGSRPGACRDDTRVKTVGVYDTTIRIAEKAPGKEYTPDHVQGRGQTCAARRAAAKR